MIQRRRAMAVVSGNGVRCPYMKNGLVLWLDGIEKGPMSDRWQNLMGNSYYPFNEATSIENNAVLFDGTDGLQETGDITYVDGTVGTIEICGQFTQSQNDALIFTSGDADGIAAFKANGKLTYKSIAPFPNSLTFDNVNTIVLSPFTASLRSTGGFLNGVASTGTAGDGWSADSKRICGKSGFQFNAKMRIYSIRVYNRLLSDAEILANQRIDNNRFLLGLNI